MIDFIIQKAGGGTINLYSKNASTLSTVTNAEQSQGLNSDDLVRITVESAVKITFDIGDKMNILGRWYKINRLPTVKKTGNRLFTYNIELEGVQYDLARVVYDLTIDTTSNALQDVQADMLTGNLQRFATVLIANANRVFPGKWVLGDFPAGTEDKTLVFGETDNCLLVLQKLCSEYNTEFEIIQAGDVNTLHFRKAGQIYPYTFEYGKGKGLYSLERLNVSTSNIVTRLKVYGGTRNITAKYRAARLCLPGKTKGQSYIQKTGPANNYGIWEATKIFEHIYPKRTGTVTAIDSGNVLKLTDSTMNFDLNEKEADGITTKYLIDGSPAKIHFNTGNLSGYEFEIQSYDHATKTFTLKPFEDERGERFPSEKSTAFKFAVNDKYVLLDIALPQSYIDDAEEQLAEEGGIYYDQNSQPKVQYSLEVAEEFLKELSGAGSITNIFSVGDYIPVKDTDIDVDKSVRVQSFTRDLLNPFSYKLNISDTVTTNITNRVISELIEIDKITKINDIKSQVKARRDWRSAQELLDMVFDTEGDYYSEKIKPNSIETQMLSVGAKSQQFGLVGTVIQANYNGNKNSVNVKGGVLSHYTIEENGRDWNLADNTTTLTGDATPYYIYAKCQKSGTAGSIIFSTQKITVEQDPLFYHFFVGVVNSVDIELGVRSVALTYGFTTINGRFIRTGRIQSNDGLTYFDLDLGEIGGKITFRSTGGTDEDLAEILDGVNSNIQDAQAAVNNLQIGGRNLALNTSAEWKPLSWEGWYWTGNFINYTEAKPNEIYTISIHLRNVEDSLDGAVRLWVWWLNEEGVRDGTSHNGSLVYDEGISKATFTIPEGKYGFEASIRGTERDSTKSCEYRMFKAEKGNKATDWTPAPEDVEAIIATAKTDAENAAKAYANTKAEAERVLAEAYADGKVSAEEQARIDDVNTKLAAAKEYAESQDALLKIQQEAYADGKASEAELAAIAAAEAYANLKKTEAEAYADGKVSAEEARAIADATAKFNEAKTHAEQLVNDIEIGGVNLLNGTSEDWETTNVGQTWSYPYGGSTSTPMYFDVKEGTYYTFSVEVKDVPLRTKTFIRFFDSNNQVISNHGSNEWTEANTESLLYTTGKAPAGAVSLVLAIAIESVAPNTTVYYRKGQLEEGSKRTSWGRSQNDILADITTAKQEALTAAENAQNTANSLKDFTDTAFRDGIIDRSESVAIEKYKNSLNETMSKAEASYNKVYTNTYLEGTAKTSLLNAKINLWGQRDTLLSAINTAISGGTTTPAQKTSVDNAFNTFNNLMTAFQNALEEANKAIQTKLDAISKGYVDNLEIGGRNLLIRSTLIKDRYLDQSTGNLATWAGLYTTDFIEVVGGADYTFFAKKNATNNPYQSFRLAYYDINKTYLSGLIFSQADEIYRIKTPINAAFIRFSNGGGSGYTSLIDGEFKVEKGTKATGWQLAPEDVDAAIDTAIDGIEIGGRNLLTKAKVLSWSGTSQGADAYGDYIQYLSSSIQDANLTSGIVFENDTQYTFSILARLISGARPYFRIRYTDGTYSPNLEYDYTVPTYVTITSTKGKTIDYITHSRNTNGANRLYKWKLEKGNKPTDWTPAIEDTEREVLEAQGYMRARYVRDWSHGSDGNPNANHWREVEVVNKSGINLAKNKVPTTNGTPHASYPLTNATDGDINTTAINGYSNGASHDYIQIDLGQVYYDIDFIKVIHSTNIERTYFGTKTEISEDGVNWTTIFDSAVEGTYAETAEGKIHTQRYASVISKLNQSKAITDKFGTTIDNGLVATVLLLLREYNSTQNTSGLSGIQKDANGIANQPSYWSGGTHEQAQAFVPFVKKLENEQSTSLAEYNNLPKIVFLHSGAAKVGHFIVLTSGEILIVDPSTGSVKLKFTTAELPSITDLVAGTNSQGSTAVGAGVASISSSQVVSGSTQVSKNGAIATFNGTHISLSARGIAQAGGMASFAEAVLYARQNGVRVQRLASVAVHFTNTVYEDKSAEVLPVPFSFPLDAGTYTFELVIHTTGTISSGNAVTSASNLSWKHTVAGVKKQQYSKDGMMFFYSNRHFYFNELTGLDVKESAYNKFEMPGVLAAGSVDTTGVQTNVWGAKSNPAGAGSISGGRSVPLANMKHSNYVVQITPHTATTFRVGTKTISSFQAIGTGGFDYVVIGNNY